MRRGEGTGRGKREPIGMARDFDLQLPVIYIMFKLTIRVKSTTTAANFEGISWIRS